MNNKMIKNSGCLLLCGGKSRRMGMNKAKITINGRTFLDIMGEKLRKSGLPCYLSLNVPQPEMPEGFTVLYDEIWDLQGKTIGPMGGIYTALKKAGKDGLNGLYVVPVDAPLFDIKLFERLYNRENADIMVFSDSKNRIHPLFGYYSTDVIDVIEELAAKEDYKLLNLLFHPIVQTEVISLKDQNEDRMLSNINDPDAYAALLKSLSKGKKHLFIQGERGCGKTTLIQKTLAQTDLCVGGFATKAVRNQITGEREIWMYPASFLKNETDQETAAIQHGMYLGTAENGIQKVRIDVFDSYGTALLEEAEKAQLIVMDELGTMETEADLFTKSVLHTLNQDVPVLGVVKTAEKTSTFLEQVRFHDNVEIIELTEGNRQEVEIRLQQWLQEVENKQRKAGNRHEA